MSTAGAERRRVLIEGVYPEIDAGRFPIKRVPGEEVAVEADAFADGHDAVSVVLCWRADGEAGDWHETPMELGWNDRWSGSFRVGELGRYRYTVVGWVDRFRTWYRDLRKKVDAGVDVSVDLLVGAELAAAAAKRAKGPQRTRLRSWAKRLEEAEGPEMAFDPELRALMEAHPDRSLATTYPRELEVVVDPPRAGFSSWYEFFPRSFGSGENHGILEDAERVLPYVARMGFDIVYLPPIHPIGTTNRKGKNNAPRGEPGDVGSPWAIGSEDGGHTAVHPDLGTLEDFDRFVAAARRHGLEVAMDVAYQCSPDHPWTKEHPEWFRRLPDGTIRYAENPPKRYEDIYPLDFETEAWQELWEALRGVVEFWIDRGITIFRVDNPHTKAFPFWEWMIAEVKARHPEVIFLSEAFTRPRVMYALAKLGFTQSYTYFTWRNAKWELESYFADMAVVGEFFRPNLWPNTPDILPELLQWGGRPAFMSRLILAATLSANYGIYGPAFELCVSEPVAPGREEYLHSEKFEIRSWNLDDPGSLADLIGRINRIRRENPALQTDRTLQFHPIDNEELIAYSKVSDDGENAILTVVNLDPSHARSGWVSLPLAELGISEEHPYQVHDLLTDARYLWHGPHNYVEIDPHSMPAHIFRLRHRVRTEHDFDYFM